MKKLMITAMVLLGSISVSANGCKEYEFAPALTAQDGEPVFYIQYTNATLPGDSALAGTTKVERIDRQGNMLLKHVAFEHSLSKRVKETSSQLT